MTASGNNNPELLDESQPYTSIGFDNPQLKFVVSDEAKETFEEGRDGQGYAVVGWVKENIVHLELVAAFNEGDEKTRTNKYGKEFARDAESEVKAAQLGVGIVHTISMDELQGYSLTLLTEDKINQEVLDEAKEQRKPILIKTKENTFKIYGDPTRYSIEWKTTDIASSGPGHEKLQALFSSGTKELKPDDPRFTPDLIKLLTSGHLRLNRNLKRLTLPSRAFILGAGIYKGTNQTLLEQFRNKSFSLNSSSFQWNMELQTAYYFIDHQRTVDDYKHGTNFAHTALFFVRRTLPSSLTKQVRTTFLKQLSPNDKLIAREEIRPQSQESSDPVGAEQWWRDNGDNPEAKNKLLLQTVYIAAMANQPDIIVNALEYIEENLKAIKRKLEASVSKDIDISQELSDLLNQPLSRHNYNALMVASWYGSLKALNQLLEKKPSLDLVDTDGNTALMIAAQSTYASLSLAVIEKLINSGADVNHQNNEGDTALIKAIRSDKPAIVKTLLANGAKSDIPNKEGYTALMIAAYEQNASAIQILLENIPNKNSALEMANEKNGSAPLVLAMLTFDGSKLQSIETLKILIKSGANVHRRDRNGDTALMFAVKYNLFDAVKIILEHQQIKDEKDYLDALIIAISNNHTGIAELLIDALCDAFPEKYKADTPGRTNIFEQLKDKHLFHLMEYLLTRGNTEAKDINKLIIEPILSEIRKKPDEEKSGYLQKFLFIFAKQGSANLVRLLINLPEAQTAGITIDAIGNNTSIAIVMYMLRENMQDKTDQWMIDEIARIEKQNDDPEKNTALKRLAAAFKENTDKISSSCELMLGRIGQEGNIGTFFKYLDIAKYYVELSELTVFLAMGNLLSTAFTSHRPFTKSEATYVILHMKELETANVNSLMTNLLLRAIEHKYIEMVQAFIDQNTPMPESKAIHFAANHVLENNDLALLKTVLSGYKKPAEQERAAREVLEILQELHTKSSDAAISIKKLLLDYLNPHKNLILKINDQIIINFNLPRVGFDLFDLMEILKVELKKIDSNLVVLQLPNNEIAQYRQKYANTALLTAIRQPSNDMLDYLLNYGATHSKALEIAIKQRNMDKIEYLFKGVTADKLRECLEVSFFTVLSNLNNVFSEINKFKDDVSAAGKLATLQIKKDQYEKIFNSLFDKFKTSSFQTEQPTWVGEWFKAYPGVDKLLQPESKELTPEIARVQRPPS